MKSLLSAIPLVVVLCVVRVELIAGQANTNQFNGVSTNDVVARPEERRLVDATELAEALGVRQWNFLVQVPDGTDSLSLSLRFAGEGTERKLGDHLVLKANEWDSTVGRSIPGVKRFRVLVMILPADMSAEDPIRGSAKLRVFAKEFLSGSSSSALIPNPFYKSKGGVATYGLGGSRRYREPNSSVSEGFGSRFDLMEVDGKGFLSVMFSRNAWIPIEK